MEFPTVIKVIKFLAVFEVVPTAANVKVSVICWIDGPMNSALFFRISPATMRVGIVVRSFIILM